MTLEGCLVEVYGYQDNSWVFAEYSLNYCYSSKYYNRFFLLYKVQVSYQVKTRAYKAHYPARYWRNLFLSGAPHIHILPQFCNDSACCLVYQRPYSLGKFQGQYTK